MSKLQQRKLLQQSLKEVLVMIIQDFKYALRLLAKKPGFTALTTLVMAAGIGLSVYMFSFFNTVLYKDLPFENGDSIITISGSQNGTKTESKVNILDYEAIEKSIKGLSEFGAYYNQSVNVAGRDGARRYNGVFAQENIFEITRTKPLLGREFTTAETLTGAELVVVISYDLWQNQLGGDAKVLDQNIQINSESYRVIGVMPQGYFFPNVAQLWLPLKNNLNELTREQSVSVRGIAHINSGVSLEEIDTQLSVIMTRIAVQYPETNTGIGAYATTIPGSGAGNGQGVIYSMHIVAVFILVLASINVGNLLLSRAIERGKETAIRVALGAPRSRLISQMLWESIIICCFGGVIGLLVAAWGLEISEAITATFFIDPPAFWWKFGLDAYTIKLFLAIVVGTILVTGLLPAWKNSGGDFNAVLRDGTRGALGKKAGRLNKLLVISEIFISMAVLIAASVMVYAAYKQSNYDIGANTDNTLTARVILSESDYDTDEKKVQFSQQLKSRLENGLGVESVMLASALPGDYALKTSIAIEGKEYTQNKNTSFPKVNYISIMPEALAKLGVELKQGRYFNNTDHGLDKSSVLVSESFVKANFVDESPIGKRLRVTNNDEVKWLSIIGVVENTIQGNRETKGLPTIFRPFTQLPRNQISIAIKMKADQSVVTNTLRKTLQSIDPQLPSFKIETYEQSNERYTAPILFISKLISLFGLAAAFLAASGIYGVMSNTINQRTQEIGIKRALGADEDIITKEYLMTGFKQLLWGGIPGILAGTGMGFAMSQTFGTGNFSLIIIAVTTTVFIGAIVMYATYAPTQKALQLEPSDALHYE
ncbi:ABC transporter permease [Colwellia sp. 12G3]|nr:ABC transporter permease [Colwellia sp. 12G3]